MEIRGVPIQDLTPEAFAPYGQAFVEPGPEEQPTIVNDRIRFYMDRIHTFLGSNPTIGWLRVNRYTDPVTAMERHVASEVFTAQDQDYVILVAPYGDLDIDKVVVFLVKKGQAIALRGLPTGGTWHCTPNPVKADWMDVQVITRGRIWPDDCEEVSFPEGLGLQAVPDMMTPHG